MSYLKRDKKKQKISYENTSDANVARDNLHLAYAFNEEIFPHFAIKNRE